MNAHVLVDLLCLAVALQHAAQHTGATHPDDLGWQACLRGTLALTSACKLETKATNKR